VLLCGTHKGGGGPWAVYSHASFVHDVRGIEKFFCFCDPPSGYKPQKSTCLLLPSLSIPKNGGNDYNPSYLHLKKARVLPAPQFAVLSSARFMEFETVRWPFIYGFTIIQNMAVRLLRQSLLTTIPCNSGHPAEPLTKTLKYFQIETTGTLKSLLHFFQMQIHAVILECPCLKSTYES